jgi:uncharacterized protein
MLYVALAHIAEAASASSFDCNNASTTLENIICEDGVIADLDISSIMRRRSGFMASSVMMASCLE